MKIEIKLFATLRKHLPPNADGSSATIEIEDGLTVGGLIEHLKVPKELAQLVLVNGVNIEGDYARKLEEGDTVSIFPPVAGGAGSESKKSLAIDKGLSGSCRRKFHGSHRLGPSLQASRSDPSGVRQAGALRNSLRSVSVSLPGSRSVGTPLLPAMALRAGRRYLPSGDCGGVNLVPAGGGGLVPSRPQEKFATDIFILDGMGREFSEDGRGRPPTGPAGC